MFLDVVDEITKGKNSYIWAVLQKQYVKCNNQREKNFFYYSSSIALCTIFPKCKDIDTSVSLLTHSAAVEHNL